MRVDGGKPRSAKEAQARPSPDRLGRLAPRRFLIPAAAVIAVYGQCVGFEFLSWDDGLHTVDNPHLNPLTAASLRRLWSGPYELLYIPVSYTFFAGEAFLSRLGANDPGEPLAPWVFHLGNLLLHVAVTLLVQRILEVLVVDRKAACVGACLFALHPLQAESVAWISETRGVLAAALSLGAALIHLSDVRRAAAADDPSRTSGLGRRAAAFGLFTAGLLAKPSAAAVPAMLVVLDVLILRCSPRRVALLLWPWFAAALAAAVLTKLVQPVAAASFVAPWWSRPFLAGDAAAFYFLHLVAPWNLCAQYDHSVETVVGSGGLYAAWLLPVAVGAAALGLRSRYAAAAFAIFVLGFLPAAGLVPAVYQRLSNVADRYVYLALLGPALATAAWLARRPSQRNYACATVVLASLAVLSARQTATWRDNFTLYNHTLAVNPQSALSRMNLGLALLHDDRPAESVAEFEQALRSRPDYLIDYYSRVNLGVALSKLGRNDEAASSLEAAVRLQPELVAAYVDLGSVYEQTGRVAESVAAYRRALAIDPQQAAAHAGLGTALLLAGDVEEAVRELRAALALQPGDGETRVNLAGTLVHCGDAEGALSILGDPEAIPAAQAKAYGVQAAACELLARPVEAVAAYRRALALDPQLVPLAEKLAWLLATHEEASIRDEREALHWAYEANKATGFGAPELLDVWAAALANAGRYAEAATTARAALAKSEATRPAASTAELAARLQLYDAQRPFRRANPQASGNRRVNPEPAP